MSHYNSSSANSWQNRSNTSSGTSSLFGTPHDLLNYSSAAAQQLSAQNNAVSSLTSSSNNSSLVGQNLNNSYNSPTASLLAQFAAVNSVNFSNLAATLPAALVNANVLAAANLAGVAGNSVGNNNINSTGGYQWFVFHLFFKNKKVYLMICIFENQALVYSVIWLTVELIK